MNDGDVACGLCPPLWFSTLGIQDMFQEAWVILWLVHQIWGALRFNVKYIWNVEWYDINIIYDFEFSETIRDIWSKGKTDQIRAVRRKLKWSGLLVLQLKLQDRKKWLAEYGYQYPYFDNSQPTFQFSSVTQTCQTLCDSMDCSTPGFPVHHLLPESIQTHVHRVGDAIQPSHLLSSPSFLALNLPQHQGLF